MQTVIVSIKYTSHPYYWLLATGGLIAMYVVMV